MKFRLLRALFSRAEFVWCPVCRGLAVLGPAREFPECVNRSITCLSKGCHGEMSVAKHARR